MFMSMHRNFKKGNLRFRIQNCPERDKRTPADKYFLEVFVENRWNIVYEPGLDHIARFKTIREAQFWAGLNVESIPSLIL